MDKQAVLAQLKAQIQTLHAEDWAAFERLSRRLLASPEEPSTPTLKVTESAEAFGTASLIGSVEHVFRSDPDRAWSVQLVEKQLRKNGFVFGAKNPRSSLNTAVARLAERGLITIYKRGSGRKPHFYKIHFSDNATALRGRFAAMPESSSLFSNGKAEEVEEQAERQMPIS